MAPVPEQRIYFPVGKPMPPEQVAKLSHWQIQHRDLNDPRYAGFDPKFDWHPYFHIDIADQSVRTRVEKSLDEIASTPEGQQSIRQAFAAQQAGLQYSPPQKGRSGVIEIKAVPTGKTGFIASQSIIQINPAQLASLVYIGAEDGQLHQASYQMVLYHELGHAKDGLLNSFANLKAVQIGIGLVPSLEIPIHQSLDSVRETLGVETPEDHWFEMPVIWETNRFMQRYFHEAPRLSHNESPLLPVFYAMKADPDLTDDNFHSQMFHPAATPPGAKKQNGLPPPAPKY